MCTPGGSVALIRSTAACTARATAREFSPWSIMAIPATISPRPSRVAAPCRSIGAKRTSPSCADEHRHAVVPRHDDVPHVVERGHQRVAADQQRLRTAYDRAAPRTAVVPRESLERGPGGTLPR